MRAPVAEPAAPEPAAAAKRASDNEQASAGSERPTDPAQSPPPTSREGAPGLLVSGPSRWRTAQGGAVFVGHSDWDTEERRRLRPRGQRRYGGSVLGSEGSRRFIPGRGADRAPEGAGVTRSAIPRGGYQVRPPYPASARQQGIQGTALLRVYVAADGRVTSVAVARSAGHADLDQAAADAVRQWRFDPGRRGDEAVGMWVQVPVEFRLR